MLLAENSVRHVREFGSISMLDTIAVGIGQAFAVIPGVSRSGITISTALFRNFDRESAARLSFLLSTPAIGAAAAKTLYEIHKNHGLRELFNTQFVVGVTVSAVTGCAVIAWFLQYLHRSTLRPFVYYRIIFGIIVLALAFIRRPA
jgi:undecaprenyl-diphosphatase